jgi:hypothetical protein
MLKRQITQTHRFCQQAKWLWPLKNIVIAQRKFSPKSKNNA